MEVREDFERRVAALIESIPPESVGMLLKAVLPKTVPVSRKEPGPRSQWRPPSGPTTRRPRAGRNAEWQILKPNAHVGYSKKSARHWIAAAATSSPEPAVTRTLEEAMQLLTDVFGRSDIKMDLPWLVRMGYIQLVEGEK